MATVTQDIRSQLQALGVTLADKGSRDGDDDRRDSGKGATGEGRDRDRAARSSWKIATARDHRGDRRPLRAATAARAAPSPARPAATPGTWTAVVAGGTPVLNSPRRHPPGSCACACACARNRLPAPRACSAFQPARHPPAPAPAPARHPRLPAPAPAWHPPAPARTCSAHRHRQVTRCRGSRALHPTALAAMARARQARRKATERPSCNR